MYEAVIGLEIHAQLNTKTKMFCANKNDSDETQPNVHICPVCMGHPGTLPVPNKKAVESVIKVGLATGCKIAQRSKFDRKNYFYPDLPKGYQISQYDMPLCEHGKIQVAEKEIRVTRIHLEEDTGRLVHGKLGSSFVDFNRAGVPLMELVTEPDIRNADEAVVFARKLQMILQYLDVSDANLDKGQMRCEVNISMREKDGPYGTKVEVKNLNSFSAVKESIEYEMKRQSALLGKGEKVIQETRGWDDNKKATVSQRLKESAHDYRYFPEPDIPPLVIGKNQEEASLGTGIDLEELASLLPELPDQKKKRFCEAFGLLEKDAEILIFDKHGAAFFEHVASELTKQAGAERIQELVRLAMNYLNTDVRKLLHETSTSFQEMLMTPENFAELVVVLADKKITSAVGKAVLDEMFRTGKNPNDIIMEKGLAQVSDTAELEKSIKEIIATNEKVVTDYKAGKQNALQFLLGQLMAKTKGKADPEMSKEIFRKLLA